MNNKILHYGLIITFAILYLATAFVSFYHAIEFFNLSNQRWLSVILSLVAEIGQATVLFSLLMSKDKNKLMPWVIMFILTALQVIGNVYSCYVYIEEAQSPRFIHFQKSILFFLEESPENMKVIVAWITGSLLPIIALCLTSLVAENLNISSLEGDDDTSIENNQELPKQELVKTDQYEAENLNIKPKKTSVKSVLDKTNHIETNKEYTNKTPPQEAVENSKDFTNNIEIIAVK